MAANMLMKTNIRGSIMSIYKSPLLLPLTNASSLFNQTKTETLQFPLEQQPQLAGSSSFPHVDFDTANQRVLQSLGFQQVPPLFSIQECLKNHMETRGSSKKNIEEEYEDKDLDELDDDEVDLSDDPDAESFLDSDEDGDIEFSEGEEK